MLGMWEGKFSVVVLAGLAQEELVTIGWYNELWDIETGT